MRVIPTKGNFVQAEWGKKTWVSVSPSLQPHLTLFPETLSPNTVIWRLEFQHMTVEWDTV